MTLTTRISQIGLACRRTGAAGRNRLTVRRLAGPRRPLRRSSPPSSRARSTASRSASPPPTSSICRIRRPRNSRSAVAAATSPTNCTPRPTAASRSRNFSIWSRSAAAIVFTVPKDDMLDRHDALHQADGAVARRQCLDALPPPRHELHPHQDRGVDRDHARHGRVEDANGLRAGEIAGNSWKSRSFLRIFEPPVHHVTGLAADGARFTIRIHEAFVSAPSQSGATRARDPVR